MTKNLGRWTLLLGVLSLSVLPVAAQFSSGSTGADGALSFTNAGSYYFDPTTLTGHSAGDTIFNFTTITIGEGVTLRLDSRKLAGPVYWLASGAVQINGTLDLSGLQGYTQTTLQSQRLPSTPGAGGYAGGVGGGQGFSAAPGFGPGGGAASTNQNAVGGTYTGSQYLIPLTGGSGGGGGYASNCGSSFAAGGGGGGGAVLIASSASITVGGTITANGGQGGSQTSNSCGGAGGAGGAIRLVANTISFTSGSELTARGGGNGAGGSVGGNGFIRLEGNSVSTANVNFNGTPDIVAEPSAVSVPATGTTKITATSVNGTPIMANPFSFPDIQIDSASAVPIVISGQYVPLNATISLYIYSEDGSDQLISVPALQGTLASSSTTVQVTYPPQGSWGLIRATWQ